MASRNDAQSNDRHPFFSEPVTVAVFAVITWQIKVLTSNVLMECFNDLCGRLVDETRSHSRVPVEGQDEGSADNNIVIFCFICWDKRDNG